MLKSKFLDCTLHRPVAYLNTCIKQAFALADGLNPDPYWEEGGTPQKLDLLLLAKDPVAMDSYACRLLGFSDEDVEYLCLADKLGIGDGHTSDRDIENLDDVTVENIFLSHDQSEIKQWINTIVDQRSACSSCFGNLSSALRNIRGKNPNLKSQLLPSLCIGQEFKGKQLSSNQRGIGLCTVSKGNNALQGCPPSMESILTFLNNEFSSQ